MEDRVCRVVNTVGMTIDLVTGGDGRGRGGERRDGALTGKKGVNADANS